MNIQKFRHLNIRALKHWNIGIFEHWNFEKLEDWSIETFKHFEFEEPPTIGKSVVSGSAGAAALGLRDDRAEQPSG